MIKELLVLAAIIAAAFFIPQLLFYVKDVLLYRDIELSERESMDVEALSGNYERSLYQRMLNFSVGLEAGDSFYVTSKDLTVNQELEEYLFSNSGLYQSIMDELYSIDLIPFEFSNYQCTAVKWKQYVIYSDNYTKGVNFILWYIELESLDNITLKILADAETGTFYALRLENCSWVELDDEYSSDKFRELFQEERMASLWVFFAMYFEAFSSEQELMGMIAGRAGQESGATDNSGTHLDIYGGETREEAEGDNYGIRVDSFEQNDYSIVITDDMVWEFLREKLSYSYQERQAVFRIPYGNNSLEVFLEFSAWKPEESDLSDLSYMYPNVTLGIGKVYELIPEFASHTE